MKKIQFALLAFFSLMLFNVYAQNCPVVGWASQNGGVTGGGSASPTVVNSYAAFKSAVENAAVKVVHISGTITFPSAGRINFQDQSGKTIYGLPGSRLVSVDRSASGSGILYVKRLSNIIFRNITFEGPGAFDTDGNDNMTIDNCTNVVVDHCDFQDGMDGNLDVKNAADYISITWCRFVYLKPPIPGGSGGADDHRFSNLFGSSDGATGDRGKLRITMQNNWWAQGCKERMPRVRFGKIHLVNNYFNSAGNNHCVRAGFEADLRIESNSFENVNNPIDLFENNSTGVSSINNLFVNVTGNTAGRGTAFTPPYALAVTPAANVKAQVTAGAGAKLTSPNCAGGGGGTTTFTLTTTASPTAGGTIARNPSGTFYNSGTVVSLTATPASRYTFTGWSGAVTSIANPINVTMDANKTVTANFQLTQAGTFTLTTNVSPAAGGSISRSPNAASYSSGTVVTLTATPASGYTFTSWSGAVTSTANPITVTMDANKTVTANFQTTGGGGTNATIRIEDNATAATGLCSFDGSISSNSGASNGNVINLSNSAGRAINWRVNAPSAGSYTLAWRYVNSSSSNAFTMRLLVNGATVNGAQSFARTGSSSTFATSTATVNLVSGGNTIRLETVAASATADIDWLEVTGTSPSAGNCGSSARMATEDAATANSSYEKVPVAEHPMNVFPNPAKGVLNISSYSGANEKITVVINAADGKPTGEALKFSSVKGDNRYSLNVSQFKPGNYFLVIVHQDGVKEVKRVTIL